MHVLESRSYPETIRIAYSLLIQEAGYWDIVIARHIPYTLGLEDTPSFPCPEVVRTPICSALSVLSFTTALAILSAFLDRLALLTIYRRDQLAQAFGTLWAERG